MKYTNEFLIEDLQRVAKIFHKKTLPVLEYHKHGKVHYDTVARRFGCWNKAIAAAGLEPYVKNKKGYFNGHKRHHVHPLLALKILKRDRYKCGLCNANPAKDSNVELHIDHIKPVSHGGEDTPSNLWVLCATCNLKKFNKVDRHINITAREHILRCNIQQSMRDYIKEWQTRRV